MLVLVIFIYFCCYTDKLFEEIDWGTDRVFYQQKQIAESLGVKINVLPQMLQDVVRGKCEGFFFYFTDFSQQIIVHMMTNCKSISIS